MTNINSPTAGQKIIDIRTHEPLELASQTKKWQRVRVNTKFLVAAVPPLNSSSSVRCCSPVGSSPTLCRRRQHAMVDGDHLRRGLRHGRIGAGAVGASWRRSHRKWYARLVGDLRADVRSGITTKSLSQIGEQMFSQRLVEVHKAQTVWKSPRRTTKVR